MFILATPAQAGVIEFFFPWLKTGRPQVEQNLQAPFAEETAGQRPAELPQNAVPLPLPHRNTHQIAQFVVMAASETLSIPGPDLAAHTQNIQKYFDPAQQTALQQFFQDSQIAANLQNGQYQLRCVVEGEPLLLNEGTVEGAYRWLFDVKVMLTYLPRNMQYYQQAQPINRNLRLVVQVGRSASATDPEGVWIDVWRLSEQKN